MSTIGIFILVSCIFCPTSFASYQFLKLAETWPPTFCWNRACGRIPKKFTIHGLWPSNYSGPQPRECLQGQPGESLKKNMISRLLGRLTNSWPNLIGQDFDFWKYEWKMHGTCSFANFNQFQYFELADDIYRKDDLHQILVDDNKEPSNTVDYPAADIARALRRKIGFDVELAVDHPPSCQLKEIRLCLDVVGSGYMSCPNPRCPLCRNIYLPD